jgi:hypothetical protein
LALAKADIWGHLATPQIKADFDDVPVRNSVAVPSRDILARVHAASSDFLAAHMPELLATARALDPDLRIVPFSGLGRSPSRAAADAGLTIRPRDVRPVWPAAPLIVALSEARPELFPEFAKR